MALRKRIKRRNFTDPRLAGLLGQLSRGSGFWKAVAKKLSAPTNSRVAVNVSKLERLGWERVVVPGKVLGAGRLTKKVEVVAYSFSQSAEQKIKKAGGRAIPIEEEFSKNPEARGLKVVV